MAELRQGICGAAAQNAGLQPAGPLLRRHALAGEGFEPFAAHHVDLLVA